MRISTICENDNDASSSFPAVSNLSGGVGLFGVSSLLPLPQWSREMPSVELYAVLIEDAEDGAAAVEAADGPDVVDGVAAVVH